MYARIAHISSFLPVNELTNNDLSLEFPEWSVEKISEKTGIRSRHIAGSDEFTSDLAFSAAKKLMSEVNLDPHEVDYIILCTQSPDFLLPTTACLVQDKLGIPTSSGATDITLGCSGYVYGLGLAKGLIETHQATKILLLTGDTYSKYLNPMDKSVRTIFGDGASATLLVGDSETERLHSFTYGTDGSGAKSLIVPKGGLREGIDLSVKVDAHQRNLESSEYDLYMDGPEIFNFTIKVVPETIDEVLKKKNLNSTDIDKYVFHQANKFMLDHLRNRAGIPPQKFPISIEHTGNTVSSTIPIAIESEIKNGGISNGDRLMLLGFGVGLSWAGCIVEL